MPRTQKQSSCRRRLLIEIFLRPSSMQRLTSRRSRGNPFARLRRRFQGPMAHSLRPRCCRHFHLRCRFRRSSGTRLRPRVACRSRDPRIAGCRTLLVVVSCDGSRCRLFASGEWLRRRRSFGQSLHRLRTQGRNFLEAAQCHHQRCRWASGRPSWQPPSSIESERSEGIDGTGPHSAV